MAIRFYKKLEPSNQPVLSDGSRLDFKTLDHVIGYYAIDNEGVHAELEKMMTQGRYQISEVTSEEFMRDYVEKKKALGGQTLRKPWREELGPNRAMQDTLIPSVKSPSVAASVLVPSVLPEPTTQSPVIAQVAPVASANVSDFRPPVAKRNRPAKKK